MTKFIITHFTLTPLKVPLLHPLRQSNGTISELMVLALTLHTKDGITGQSSIYVMGKYGHTALIPYIENELLPQIINQEFESPEDVWKSLWLPRRDKLKGGLCLYALALIDIACWDITAIANQKSLHLMLGGDCTSVPVYGSGGWLSMSLDELHAECSQFMQKGISTYKIKIGGKNDEDRIAFLRHEFGNKIQIAVDANQLLRLDEAIVMGVMLQNYGVSWFEDPLFSDSIYAMKKLSKKIQVPVCVGENYHSEWQFEDACEADFAEILQVDVVRCGGITSFLKIITVAESYNKELITHLMPELSISLFGLRKKNYVSEIVNLFPVDFFTQSFDIINGKLEIPSTKGTGVYINADMVKRFRV